MIEEMRYQYPDHDDLVDILSEAFFSGYSWACVDWDSDLYNSYREPEDCIEDILAKMLLDEKSINVTDEDDHLYILTYDKIKHGLNILNKKYPRHWCDYVTYNDDFYTMDALIQCSLFNDIIYG